MLECLPSLPRVAVYGLSFRRKKHVCVCFFDFFFFCASICQVFKFSFYVIFFAVMFTLYGVPPLNLIRDIYMSFDQLQRKLQAFFRYWGAVLRVLRAAYSLLRPRVERVTLCTRAVVVRPGRHDR